MSTNDIEIGQRLLVEREALGLSQRDLEQYSGISQSTIHRIEKGQRSASLLELSSLADACGVLISDLQGTNTISEKVLCAGRTSESGTSALANYLLYAFGLTQRLDELGVAEVA